jgi:lactate 2-monooxygenase
MARMSAGPTGCVHGSAGTGLTNKRYLESFKRHSLSPADSCHLAKTGKGTSSTPISATLSWARICHIPSPIALAPVGVPQIFQPQCGIRRCSRSHRVPNSMCHEMSTASSTSIEGVAKASGEGLKWFQFYWPSNQRNDITRSIFSRAKKAGFKALFVMLDTYVLGWRPSEMDNGYNPVL